MRSRGLGIVLAVVIGLLAGLPLAAHGHGGVPAPQQILWRGDSLLLPTPYWGLFVRSPQGEWHWICDEAINAYQQHTFAVGSDGTLYVTDRAGMQVSRDGGCTWESITGPLSTLYVVNMQAIAQSSRVWALASSDGGGASLWTSDDQGQSWQQRLDVRDVWPAGVRVSADGQTIVAGVMTSAAPRQAQLLLSQDGGRTFATQTVFHLVGGQPLSQLTPLWIDPLPPHDIWLAGRVDAVSVLLQLQGSTPPREHLRLTVSIFDMLADPQSGTLVVATAGGLYSQTADSPFSSLSTLSTSRCLSAHADSLYACGWNFQPDLAAVVQLQQSATQRTRVFQYQDTAGPQSCPAESPVARICPMAWNIYADQLGIPARTAPATTPSGCALTMASKHDGSGRTLCVMLSSLIALGYLWQRRRQHAR